LNAFIERQPRATYEKVMFERAQVLLIKSRYSETSGGMMVVDGGSKGNGDRAGDEPPIVLPAYNFVGPRGFSPSKLERWYKDVWVAERRRCTQRAPRVRATSRKAGRFRTCN
jgi:hypothetical protein